MYLKSGNHFSIFRPPEKTLGEILDLRDSALARCLVNGRPMENWVSYRPQHDDVVLIEPTTGGPIFALGAILSSIVGTIVSFGISMLAQALSPKPKTPNMPRAEAQRYGIAGLDNTIEEGLPKPVVYGERRVWPHVIASRVDVADDGKSMRFAVLGLIGGTGGDGYESIFDPEINDSPIANFAGTSWGYRLGTDDQAVVEGFEDIQQVFSDNRPIPNLVELQTVAISGSPSGGTYTLTIPSYGTTAAIDYNDDGPAVQAHLRAVAGLGSVTVEEDGTPPNRTFNVSFDGTTGDVGTMTAADSLTPAKAKISIKTSRKGSEGSASPIVYPSKNEVDRMTAIFAIGSLSTMSFGRATVTIKIEQKKHSEGEGAWVESSGSPIQWSGKTVASMFKPFSVDFATKDYWDLRFSLVKSNATVQPTLYNIQETEFTTLNYGGNALGWIKGIGSGQITSLASMRWSFKVKGKKVKRPVLVAGEWDGSTYETVYTRQRMWQTRDAMTHPKVGLGHRISESLFDNWAALDVQELLDASALGEGGVSETDDYCDVIVNEQRPGWNWITQDFLGEAACGLVPSGRKLKPTILAPKSPNLLWSYPGNILDDQGGPVKTLNAYPDKSINTVRGSFPNENDPQAKGTTATVELQLSTIGSDPVRPQSYQFDTITRRSEVYRRLSLLLKKAQITARRTWSTGMAGQVAEVGDVDYLSDDKVKNIRGWQGKLPAGSTTAVMKLPRLVTLETGKSYEAICRHQADNVTEKRDITTGAGTWGEVTVNPVFTTAPAEEDIWAIGEKNVAIVPVIHESITWENGRFRFVSALYDESIFDVEAIPAADDERYIGSQPKYPPLPLHDAQIEQKLVLNYDGTYTVTVLIDVTPGLALIAGTAQGGAATYITLEAGSVPVDDCYNGAWIKLIGGTGIGQERQITDFTGADLHAVPATNFSPAPGADTQYEIHFRRFGNFKGFKAEIASRNVGADYVLAGAVDGTHMEIAGREQGMTEAYRMTPISMEGIENPIAQWTQTITLIGKGTAPPAPASVTVTSHLKQVDLEVALTLPLELDFAGVEIELWKDAIGGGGTLVKGGIRVAAPSSDAKSGTATVKQTFTMKNQKYAASIVARARSVDFTNNASSWVNSTDPTTLDQLGANDTTSRSLLPVMLMDSAFFNPANTGSQTMKAPTIGMLAYGPGIVPPPDIESDLLPMTATFGGESSVYAAFHTVGAIDGASRYWKRLNIAPMGKKFAVTWTPPNTPDGNSLAAATLTVSGYTPGANDLLITLFNVDYEIGAAFPFQWYAVTAGVRAAHHSHTSPTGGIPAAHDLYVLRDPGLQFDVISVDVNPPSLGSQTAAKVAVTIEEGHAKLGDYVACIPPLSIEDDLICMGAYLSAEDTIQLMLHSIDAIDGANRTWKFVIIPSEVTDL